MPVNPYDAIPYATLPRRETHPDRMAAVGRLFGMTPAPVAACRVLEIGCGDGANLIPMAYHLGRSKFVGVDLAEAPIVRARTTTDALALTNAEFFATDFAAIGPEFGLFDYVIAHGLYSWIPADARDRLLAACRERLAPQGIAFVSYNAFPGRHIRQMFREMMLYHARDARDDSERMARARGLLEVLAGNRRLSPAWQSVLDDEIQILLAARPGTLFHDDLAPVNEPVYFHEFAAHAGRHGLQYLGDAETRLMFDPAGALDWVADPLEREQYLDFLFLRRFRQTLLCREGIPLDRNPGPDRMEELLFSSPAREEGGVLQGAHGVRISANAPAVAAVAGAMREMYPFPLPFEDLAPYAGSAEAARDILFALAQGGFADIHAHDFPAQDSVSEAPVASRLARYQAQTSAIVTSACHLPVELDETGRRLISLLDGTRRQDALARELSAPGAEIEDRLEWLAQIGLLEG